jgi:transposase
MDVIIGIDPHKSSHTAVALDAAGHVLGELRVTAGKHQIRELQTFAAPWPDRRWAVEGANGLGRLLSQQLVAAGEPVTDVPATLAARVRLLSGGSARKSDSHDARSTAIAALHGRQLRQVGPEDVTVVLRMLSDRRDQLSAARNRIVCRLHNHLRHLRPGGAPVHLTADRASRLLQGIRPDHVVAVQRKQLARELVVDLRKIDKQLADIDGRIVEAVTASHTSLTDIVGIGAILAATIIGHAGDIGRFPSRAHFASYAGTAPIEASSGDVSRHRLSRRGNRRLNAAIHMVVLSQLSHTSPGRAYVDRRMAEGKSRREAMRALKRQLCNVIYRQLLADVAAARAEMAAAA